MSAGLRPQVLVSAIGSDRTRSRTPITAIAAYGTPVLKLTGGASGFATNGGSGAATSLVFNGTTAQAVSGNAETGLVDLPYFGSGLPAHKVGVKWVCTISNSASSGVLSSSACGNVIASGDLLVVAYAYNYGGTPTAPTMSTPSGFTSIGSNYSNLATDPLISGVFYKIAGASEGGNYSTTITNYTPARAGTTALIDYGPTSGSVVSGTFGATATPSSGGIPGNSINAATASDLLVGFYSSWSPSKGFGCPSGMFARTNSATLTNSTSPELLICDKQLSASGATGAQNATQTSNDNSQGVLFSITPQ